MKTVVERKRLKCGAFADIFDPGRKPRTKRIHADFFAKFLACGSQVNYFRTIFPKGMELTRDNLKLAALERFSIKWVFYNLLTDEVCDKVDKKLAQLTKRITKRFNAAKEKQRAGLINWKKYEELCAKTDEDARIAHANLLADVLGLE
jgi:hypothetical protein